MLLKTRSPRPHLGESELVDREQNLGTSNSQSLRCTQLRIPEGGSAGRRRCRRAWRCCFITREPSYFISSQHVTPQGYTGTSGHRCEAAKSLEAWAGVPSSASPAGALSRERRSIPRGNGGTCSTAHRIRVSQNINRSGEA